MKLNTLFVENLTNIDFALFSIETGIIGQSYMVDLELTGNLNEVGFVYDFGRLKKSFKQSIDNEFDHKLIFSGNNSAVKVSKSTMIKGNTLFQGQTLTGETWLYDSPGVAVLELQPNANDVINSEEVSIESLEKAIAQNLWKISPSNIQDISVTLREEAREEISPSSPKSIFFRYTHGLPKHDGACQRIFHGHRSKVSFQINGKPELKPIEGFFSDYKIDNFPEPCIHFASRYQQCNNREIYNRNKLTDDLQNDCLKSISNEGIYAAAIPKSRIYWVEDETSVEHLSETLHSTINSQFQIKAASSLKLYEGFLKGAISKISY